MISNRQLHETDIKLYIIKNRNLSFETNIVEKEENTSYQHFFSFFQKILNLLSEIA